MNANGHGRWDDTLAAYLLGALPDGELEEFERHLEGCGRCREGAASLQVAVDVLPVGVPPVSPPPELKARVMTIVESEAELLRAAGTEADRPVRRRRGLRRWFPRPVITAGAAAAALAIGVVAGIAIVGGDDGGAGQRTLAARVTDPLTATTARASVVVDGSRAKLVVRGMPAPETGRVYQVWLKRTGGAVPVPAGATFMLRSGDVAIPRAVRDGDRVLVTSEPEGGSPAPTRAPIVVAQPV
jgi:anti-sigma-K factor RskA